MNLEKYGNYDIDGVIAISVIVGWFMFLIGLAIGKGV